MLPIILIAQDDVQLLNKSDLKDLITKRDGKVLILNVWATWCVPCREEIPDLIELHKKYSRKVDVAGLSVDYPDEIKSRIQPFIKQQKIKYKIYVNNMKDEELINYFAVKWNGAVPATFIYDKNGKLSLFMEGRKSFKDFDKALIGLLN